MSRTSPLLWALGALVLLVGVSCGPGRPTYLDRVRPLASDQAHPLLTQLWPLLTKAKTPTEADDLVRTWKDFLDTAPVPLRQDTQFTFVYYDFTHSLDKIYLEATFAPDRKEPLERWGTTSLFYRVYDVPKPAGDRYRFTDGQAALLDPFQTEVDAGAEIWHPVAVTFGPEARIERVVGASEYGLAGQDLEILLPPRYRSDLAWTYPILVVVGAPEDWDAPLAKAEQAGDLAPFLAVSVGTPADLRAALEDRIVPWVRSHHRVSTLAPELFVVGLGASAKAVQDLAAARPDFWGKAPANLDLATLKPLFPVEAP